MTTTRTHKNLDVWNTAINLAVETYAATSKYPREEMYGLALQTRRAAVSIPSNIAEGAARKTKKEFVQFLHGALGSVAELETQLRLGTRLGFLSTVALLEKVEQVRMMLLGLLRYLKREPDSHHASRITSST